MKAIGIALSGVVLLLSACATPSTVRGGASSTGESFAGTLYPADLPWLMNGGAMTFASSSSTICNGTTRPGTGGAMVADVSCDDGRSGSIAFTAGAKQTIGTGKLGNDPVTLTVTP